jgi:glucose/arabinose dehydrogenase
MASRLPLPLLSKQDASTTILQNQTRHLFQGRGMSIKRSTSLIVIILLIIGFASLDPAWAFQTAGFQETLVADGISGPTAMEFSPDGRLFVAEQAGRLRVIKNGVLLPGKLRDVERYQQ